MSRLARVLSAFAALWVFALAEPAGAGSAPAAAGRQVLVMLRLPPEHLHAGAGYAGAYGDGTGLAARRRIARALAGRHGLALVAEWPMPVLGVDCYILAAPPDASPQAVAAELSRDPRVAWSEPLQTYRAESGAVAADDPLYLAQPAAKAWRLAELHKIATGRGVRVAVVDSRVDARHPDLAGQVQLNRDFAPDHPGPAESHGTAVAAIIAAIDGNHVGIVGVAPRARLMALRACWQDGTGPASFCDTLSLARALSFAIESRAQVINLSLSGPDGLLLGRLIDVAVSRGVVVVAAADPSTAGGGFPASHTGVIAVAADLGKPPPRGVLLAPGRDVPTALPGERWAVVSGSSFAAAHVTGLVALVREMNPRATETASLFVTRGAGEIDACSTLLRVSGTCAGCGCARQARAGDAD